MELAVDHHNFIMMGGSSSTDLARLIVKGKRTKRQRSSSPSSCSSSSCRELELGLVVPNYGSTSINSASSSPTTTTSSTDQEQDQDQVLVHADDEEEDLANCLILLAQGQHHHSKKKQAQDPRTRLFEKLPPPPAIITKSGFYVYECKTCNRTFPSFQALGGHRASHKKPKVPGAAGGDEKKGSSVNTGDVESNCQLNKSCSDHHLQLLQQLPNYNIKKGSSGGTNLNFQLGISNSLKGNKIHECSICGSEFMSGQALGGHMRRHRAAAPTPPNSIVDGDQNQKEMMIRPKSTMLGLDLNLPAPEDEQQQPQQSKFQFVSSKQHTTTSLVLAAPA